MPRLVVDREKIDAVWAVKRDEAGVVVHGKLTNKIDPSRTEKPVQVSYRIPKFILERLKYTDEDCRRRADRLLYSDIAQINRTSKQVRDIVGEDPFYTDCREKLGHAPPAKTKERTRPGSQEAR